MGIQLRISDQVNSRATGSAWLLDWTFAKPLTLRELIAERVRIEWSRQAADQANPPLVAMTGAQQKPLDQVVALAHRGFETGAFLVIADDRQVTDLDEELALTSASELTFVRLLPLRGG